MEVGEDSGKPAGENCTTINLHILQVLVCSVCGDDHDTELCPVVFGFKQILDSQILSRARQTLPKNLEVKMLADGTTTVFTKAKIYRGSQFGPFQAPLSLDLPPTVVFPLKVFGKSLDEGYYLDTTDEDSCNWMCLIATATNPMEQNLICYDVNESIYFASSRDIQPGEELRVWYALYYGLKLQALPLSDDVAKETEFQNVDEDLPKSESGAGEDILESFTESLPAHVLGAPGERDVWICKLCGMQETNVASYARHLMTHYRSPSLKNLQIDCNICLKSFFSKKVLKKHKLKVHCFNEESSGGQSSNNSSETHQLFEVKSLSQQMEVKFSQTDELTSFMDAEDLCSQANCLTKHILKSQSVSEISLQNNSLNVSENKAETSKAYSASDDASLTSRASCRFKAGSEDCLDSHSELCVLTLTNQPEERDMEQVKRTDTFHFVDLKGDKIINPVEEFHGLNKEEAAKSNNLTTFAASLGFSHSVEVDVALENEEHYNLIVVEPSENGRNSVSSRRNQGSDSFTSFGSPSDMPQNDVGSAVTSSVEASPAQKTSTYTCDICEKSFEKCSYLYRHLRKHTGEFTCVTCLAVFARKENLNTHSCSQPKEWFPCPTCGKKFSAKKYLQRHTPIHTGEFTCSHCKRCFVSRLSLKFHRCNCNESTSLKSTVSCVLCKRSFDRREKLKSHLKVHSDKSKTGSVKCEQFKPLAQDQTKLNGNVSIIRKRKSFEGKVFICEICGATFKSSSSMKTHRFCHGERKFECEVCRKRFHRKDVLQEHLRVHQKANFPCALCGKKYKTKKSLYVHSLIHGGFKRFSCEVCGKDFFQKGNLLKHSQTHTSGRTYSCQYCNKSFSSKEYFNIHELTHTLGKTYSCEECKRSFVKKHLLDTHRQLFHSNRVFRCKFCDAVFRQRHSVKRHLEKCHIKQREEWSLPGFTDQLLAEVPQALPLSAGCLEFTQKQQKRQMLVRPMQIKHFQKKVEGTADEEISSDFVYSSNPVEAQSDSDTQADPLEMVTSHQLAFADNLLPEYDQLQPSAVPNQPLMISGDIQATNDQILLTLVDQDTLINSSKKNSTPILTSATLETDLNSGTAFMMEDENGSNSVLLYVVETSDVKGCSPGEIEWFCNETKEKLTLNSFTCSDTPSTSK